VLPIFEAAGFRPSSGFEVCVNRATHKVVAVDADPRLDVSLLRFWVQSTSDELGVLAKGTVITMGACDTASDAANAAAAGGCCSKWAECENSDYMNIMKPMIAEGARDGFQCPCTLEVSSNGDPILPDNGAKFKQDSFKTCPKYRHGAAYCVQTEAFGIYGDLNVGTFECCYDFSAQLITTGTGAGTFFKRSEYVETLHRI
jgi:hypothetical protein